MEARWPNESNGDSTTKKLMVHLREIKSFVVDWLMIDFILVCVPARFYLWREKLGRSKV